MFISKKVYLNLLKKINELEHKIDVTRTRCSHEKEAIRHEVNRLPSQESYTKLANRLSALVDHLGLEFKPTPESPIIGAKDEREESKAPACCKSCGCSSPS